MSDHRQSQGSIAGFARASAQFAGFSAAARKISPLRAAAASLGAANPLSRAIVRTKQLNVSVARAALQRDALERLSAGAPSAREGGSSLFLAGSPVLPAMGRALSHLAPAAALRSDQFPSTGDAPAAAPSWNVSRPIAGLTRKIPDFRSASMSPAHAMLSRTAAALRPGSTLSRAGMLGRRVARAEVPPAISLEPARNPDSLASPQMARIAMGGMRSLRRPTDAAQLNRIAASARDVRVAAGLASPNLSGLRAAIDVSWMVDARAIPAPADLRIRGQDAHGLGPIGAAVGAGAGVADRAQRAERAISRSLSFAQGHPAGPLVARGAFLRAAAAAPITFNSSPSITVNVPPGRAALNPAEINRAVGDALEKHAERIYDILRRVAARRERTEF